MEVDIENVESEGRVLGLMVKEISLNVECLWVYPVCGMEGIAVW